MTLRRRLTLLVALAVVVPITAVGVTVANLIGGELERRTFDRLRQAADFARAEIVDREERITRQTAALAAGRTAGLATQTSATRQEALRDILRDEDLDFVVLADSDGTVATSARRQPTFARGVTAPTDEELVADFTRPTLIASQAPVTIAVPGDANADATLTGTLTAGMWLDNSRLGGLFRASDVEYLVIDEERVIAATASGATLPAAIKDGAFRARIGGAEAFVVATEVPGSEASLLAAADPPQNVWGNLGAILVLLLALIVVLVVLVGHVVAGLITGPVQELVEAANEVSRGDLDQRVDAKGDVEIASLGLAFNRMTDNLRDHVRQLEHSRTELREAVDRLGDVLVSTHDLAGIIEVVLETSTVVLRAQVSAFYDRVAMPARIRASAFHGAELEAFELNGTGVAGAAARNLAASLHPPAALDAAEPQHSAAVALPVRAGGRLFGVLAVYGKVGGGQFDDDDVETLSTLARQTEVAIGNVELHNETQRQARTDGMTGLWNRREFEMRSRELVREAQRFNDPFGVIIVDADDFKHVNDRFDHLTGDAALIWIASQLSVATREVDRVFRWGGEEFTVLLPRTGPEETALVAERIRSLVAREPMVHESHNIHLTVSVGYACYPADGQTADELFRAADEAMLLAKRLGKNRVERASGEERVDGKSDEGGGAGDGPGLEVSPSDDERAAEGDPVRGGGSSPGRTS